MLVKAYIHAYYTICSSLLDITHCNSYIVSCTSLVCEFWLSSAPNYSITVQGELRYSYSHSLSINGNIYMYHLLLCYYLNSNFCCKVYLTTRKICAHSYHASIPLQKVYSLPKRLHWSHIGSYRYCLGQFAKNNRRYFLITLFIDCSLIEVQEMQTNHKFP